MNKTIINKVKLTIATSCHKRATGKNYVTVVYVVKKRKVELLQLLTHLFIIVAILGLILLFF